MAEASLRETEPEVRVMGQRIPIHDLAEALGGERMSALVEVCLAERLEDGRLTRLEMAGSFEHDCCSRWMTLLEELRATSKELVGGVALARIAAVAWMRGHARYGISSIRSRRLFSVRPGMRPRFAIGRPSISFRSPVKSIGLASLIAEPTANESMGAAASLK